MTAARGGKMEHALELPNRCEYCGHDRSHCKSQKCAKMRQQKYAREVKRNDPRTPLQIQRPDGPADV